MSLPAILWMNVVRGATYERTSRDRVRGEQRLYVAERNIGQRLEPGDQVCLWSPSRS